MKRVRLIYVLCAGLVLLLAGACTKTDELPKPVFTPEGGVYGIPQSVTITCAEEGASIRYTLDGSVPGSGSALYSAPLQISASTELKARAFKDGWTKSPIATATYTINSLLGEMLPVEGGTFSNGRGQVTLSSFYLDKYEMTQAGYIAVMGETAFHFTQQTDAPADGVSWYEAIEYCNRRSTLEGLTPCYSYSSYGTNPDNWPDGWDSNWLNQQQMQCAWDADGYRLPTEMEWMFAAKGGNLSQNYTYSGSNNIFEVAWFLNNSGDITYPVTSKLPNELGFHHMSGNLYEWTWDGYADSYPSEAQSNPHGPAISDNRVRRGGAYESPSDWCTVDFRYGNDANYGGYEVGFRVCRNATTRY